MSTAIPPNPNAIIRALLDIAQAAYVLIHSPGKDMADNLKRQVNVLEDLPQYCNNPVNGPCRASKYLESFLVGGSTLTTAGADVQRDGTEFKEHTWNAPVDGPGFTPTAEFPASGPISHDFYTHRDTWRDLIVRARQDNARFEDAKDFVDDRSYIDHELRAFDRAFDSLPPQQERRLRERMIEPAIPVVGKEALVEATRPLFVKAMQSQGHRADLDERGLYKGVSEYRWEGWRAAVESMGFKPASDDIGAQREQAEAWNAVCDALTKYAPGWQALTSRGMDSAVKAIEQLGSKSDSLAQVGWRHVMHMEGGQTRTLFGDTIECPWGVRGKEFDATYAVTCEPVYEVNPAARQAMRTNMLADTADEALRIINDAGLMRNLHELFDGSDKTGGGVDIVNWKVDEGMRPVWSVEVRTGTGQRKYESTSMHQAIVAAHKGERDLFQPEHEECRFCGFTVETPCDTPPSAECPTALAEEMMKAAKK